MFIIIGPYGLGNSSQYMPRNPMMANPMATSTEDEEVAAEDEEDMGVIETYSNYKPSKLKVIIIIWFQFYVKPKYIWFFSFFKIGRPHPDEVVETASLASVEPPDVWYDLVLPEEVINKGKLSALQLEAVTYSVSFLIFLIKYFVDTLSLDFIQYFFLPFF